MRRRRDIRRVVNWISRAMPASYRPETIDVLEPVCSGNVSGYTTGEDVELHLPTRLGRFPKRCVYRSVAGPLLFRCWHEELAAVTAHEFRHVAQNRTKRKDQPRHYEVDAEAVARFVLDIYRVRKRCRC